jgi:hypothetical protein
MSDGFEGVLGLFASADALPGAIDRAREAFFTEIELYSPIGDRESVDRLLPGTSRVRWATLAGALAGIVLGLWMTIGMSRSYPLVTGGKPIVSLPPFLVIAFELMILAAALGTVAGFLLFARLPSLRPSSAYSRDLAVDQFGLLIHITHCVGTRPDEAPRERAETALREAGAYEIRSVRRQKRPVLGEA